MVLAKTQGLSDHSSDQPSRVPGWSQVRCCYLSGRVWWAGGSEPGQIFFCDKKSFESVVGKRLVVNRVKIVIALAVSWLRSLKWQKKSVCNIQYTSANYGKPGVDVPF